MEWTYKPDSVPPGSTKTGVIISLELGSPRASSNLPENIGRASLSRIDAIPHVRFAETSSWGPGDSVRSPIWFCSG